MSLSLSGTLGAGNTNKEMPLEKVSGIQD